MLFCLFIISYFYAQNNNLKNPHTKPYYYFCYETMILTRELGVPVVSYCWKI